MLQDGSRVQTSHSCDSCFWSQKSGCVRGTGSTHDAVLLHHGKRVQQGALIWNQFLLLDPGKIVEAQSFDPATTFRQQRWCDCFS